MWIYNQQNITGMQQLPDYQNLMGFVYKITNNITGAIYIGRKNFYSTTKKALPKKELILKADGSVNKGRKTYKHVTKESDWMKYWSSCKELQNDIKELGTENFTREILELSCSTKYLGYLELKFQFQLDVLNKPSYNANIAGTYYHKDMNPCELKQAA